MGPEIKIISESESETIETGERIGQFCEGGEIIRLIGPLGAGKSVLARGIARGLGVKGQVRSPSFNLMREYKARLILRHWDLYRLEGGFNGLGLLESADDESVVIVEWADHWAELEKWCMGSIFMDYGENENERVIRLYGKIPGYSFKLI